MDLALKKVIYNSEEFYSKPFINNAGVEVQVQFSTSQQLTRFEMYHKQNKQLKKLKEDLAEALEKDSKAYVYDIEPYKDYDNAKAIMQELNAVAVTASWENKCKPGLFNKNYCSQTLQLWKTEASDMPFNTLVLAESVVFVKTNKGMKPEKKIIHITVDERDKPTFTNINDATYTTILGLGPSGCGKSFLANQIFECISFVETVVALDGGITRTSSNVYQMATAFHQPHYNIGDLYDLFKETADNKKIMAATLMTLQCTLYIPHTLVSALTITATGTEVKPELKQLLKRGIQNGKENDYIGLFIMQHCKKCGYNCPFSPEFQCFGCDTSGESRALVEGKKWENKKNLLGGSFESALTYGYRALFTDDFGMRTKYPIFIHNSGKRGTASILAHALPDATIHLSSLNPSVFRVLPTVFQKDFATFEKLLVQAVKTSVKTEFRQAVASNITETKALSSRVGELHGTVLEKLGFEVGKLTSAMSALTTRMGSLETDVASNKAEVTKELESNKAALAQLQPKPPAEVQTGPTVPATRKWWRFGFGGKKRMRTKKKGIKRSSKKSK